MTTPGFSSRDSTSTVRQFPQRDEMSMSEMTPGWSNSATLAVIGEAGPEPDMTITEPAEAEAKVVEAPSTESKTVRKSAPRKKATS